MCIFLLVYKLFLIHYIDLGKLLRAENGVLCKATDYTSMVYGMRLIVVGLIKKLILADSIASKHVLWIGQSSTIYSLPH